MNGDPVRYCFCLQVKPEAIVEYTGTPSACVAGDAVRAPGQRLG